MDKALALIWLRYRVFRNGLRSTAGLADAAGRVILVALGGVVSLGLAALVFGFLYYANKTGDDGLFETSLYGAFYTFLVLGLVLPLFEGALKPGVDYGKLQQFPLTRAQMYTMSLAASAGHGYHLFYYPGLLAVLVAAVLLPGRGLFAGPLIVLALLLVYVAWTHTLVLMLQGLMKRRKAREIIVVAVFVLLSAVGVIPAALQRKPEAGRSFGTVIPPALRATAKALPPSLGARGLTALRSGGRLPALRCLAGLLLWDACGVALGYGAFVRYHLDRGGTTARRRSGTDARATRSAPDRDIAVPFLPPEVAAAAAKELLYLARSSLGKLTLLVTPVFVVLAALLIAKDIRHGIWGVGPQAIGLFGTLTYAVLFSNNFFSNIFGWDGGGVRTYFFSPARLESVIAGKNLAVWAFNGVVLSLILGLWAALVGIPSWLDALTGVLVFATTLLGCTTAGNVISVAFPFRRDASAIYAPPSQAAVLLSMLAFVVSTAATALFLVLPALLGVGSLRPLFLLLLIALHGALYGVTLKLSARFLEARKERLIEVVGGCAAGQPLQ